MSTVETTARPAAAIDPRARGPKNPTTIPTPRTAALAGRRGLAKLLRNLGIALDTLVRVVLLGRDGVRD